MGRLLRRSASEMEKLRWRRLPGPNELRPGIKLRPVPALRGPVVADQVSDSSVEIELLHYVRSQRLRRLPSLFNSDRLLPGIPLLAANSALVHSTDNRYS